jgi:hypothetical protein
VPLARSLHPEFGYLGSGPQWWRKAGLTLVFVVCGLIAAFSSVTVFVSSPEPDPLQAMALAPSQPLIRIEITAPQAGAEASPGQRSAKSARIRRPVCRDNETENVGAECPSGRTSTPLPAGNDRPAIAAVSIGHRDEAALLPVQAAAPQTAALPEGPAAVEAATAPAVAPPPVVAVKKARHHHSRQVQRREYLPSRSSRYHDGYARVW